MPSQDGSWQGSLAEGSSCFWRKTWVGQFISALLLLLIFICWVVLKWNIFGMPNIFKLTWNKCIKSPFHFCWVVKRQIVAFDLISTVTEKVVNKPQLISHNEWMFLKPVVLCTALEVIIIWVWYSSFVCYTETVLNHKFLVCKWNIE